MILSWNNIWPFCFCYSIVSIAGPWNTTMSHCNVSWVTVIEDLQGNSFSLSMLKESTISRIYVWRPIKLAKVRKHNQNLIYPYGMFHLWMWIILDNQNLEAILNSDTSSHVLNLSSQFVNISSKSTLEANDLFSSFEVTSLFMKSHISNSWSFNLECRLKFFKKL